VSKRAKKGYVSSLQGLVKMALVQAKMTREEELTLARLAIRGDKACQDKLIRAVAVMAEHYGKQQAISYGMNVDELVAEGMVGLGMALRKFKPEKKIRFATYAIWWVRVYVDRYVKEFSDNWESTDGTKKLKFVSTETPMQGKDGESEETLGDHLRSTDEGAEVHFQDIQAKARVHEILAGAGLTDIEKSIVKYRLMDDALTLEQLGAKHGVSRERIRQLEIQLKPRLQVIFEAADD
jgi:RNA polymerase primary sigma factor